MNKKIDKALYGPSTIEVALGAVLGLLLGVGVACGFLMLKPVKVVKEPPKETVAGAVYYLPGLENNVKGRGWPQKQQSLIAGGSVVLTEEELNTWAITMHPGAAADPAKPAAPAKPGAKPAPTPAKPAPAAAPAPASTGFLTGGTVNFRIKDGKLQIGTKCTVSIVGFSQEMLVVATGGFKKSGASFVFAPETIYVGSCPVHRIPGVAAPLLRKLTALQPVSDELRAAWDRLTSVSLEGSTLRLAAP